MVQLTMARHERQLELDVRAPGARAPGAGRPKKQWPVGRETAGLAREARVHHRPAHHEIMEEVDPYSSGAEFLGWKELDGTRQFVRDEGFERVALASPRLRLTRVGWERGGEISVFTVPG